MKKQISNRIHYYISWISAVLFLLIIPLEILLLCAALAAHWDYPFSFPTLILFVWTGLFYLPTRLKAIQLEDDKIIIRGPFIRKTVYSISDFSEVKSDWWASAFRICFNDGKDFLFYPSFKYISPLYFRNMNVFNLIQTPRPDPVEAITNDIRGISGKHTN